MQCSRPTRGVRITFASLSCAAFVEALGFAAAAFYAMLGIGVEDPEAPHAQEWWTVVLIGAVAATGVLAASAFSLAFSTRRKRRSTAMALTGLVAVNVLVICEAVRTVSGGWSDSGFVIAYGLAAACVCAASVGAYLSIRHESTRSGSGRQTG